MTETLIPITDSIGKPVLHNAKVEPHPASVILTQGEFGSAWQRFFSDGLWHPVRGGRPRTWEWLTTQRNLVLVYDAEERAS
jgi:hypothetical protein